MIIQNKSYDMTHRGNINQIITMQNNYKRIYWDTKKLYLMNII